MSPHESLRTITIVDRCANHLLPLPKRSALRLTAPSFRRIIPPETPLPNIERVECAAITEIGLAVPRRIHRAIQEASAWLQETGACHRSAEGRPDAWYYSQSEGLVERGCLKARSSGVTMHAASCHSSHSPSRARRRRGNPYICLTASPHPEPVGTDLQVCPKKPENAVGPVVGVCRDFVRSLKLVLGCRNRRPLALLSRFLFFLKQPDKGNCLLHSLQQWCLLGHCCRPLSYAWPCVATFAMFSEKTRRHLAK